jgi:hypothetical protein
VRAPQEPSDDRLQRFYTRLLSALAHAAVRDGQWQLLECAPAWDGNWTWDGFVAFSWRGTGGESLIAAVNYAANQGQCYVRLPFADLPRTTLRFSDLMSAATYDRDGRDLAGRGLYLDVPAWGYHIFGVSPL